MHSFLRRLAIACTLVGLTALASQANASLLGAQFTAGYYFPDATTSYAFATFTPGSSNTSSLFTVVDPGQEATADVEGVTTLNIDFTAATLQILLNTVLTSPTWNSTTFNGLIFQSPNSLGIASAVVEPETTMAGFDASRVSFSNNEIRINWQGLSYVDGTIVKVGFGFDTVPAPSALSLLLPGLVAAGYLLTRTTV